MTSTRRRCNNTRPPKRAIYHVNDILMRSCGPPFHAYSSSARLQTRLRQPNSGLYRHLAVFTSSLLTTRAMSVTHATKKSLRILALPLVSVSKTPGTSSSHLTYYHFTTPPPHPERTKTWTNWATDKAADLWAGFGKAKEGTWKVSASTCATYESPIFSHWL